MSPPKALRPSGEEGIGKREPHDGGGCPQPLRAAQLDKKPRGTWKGCKDDKDHESVNSGIYCVTLGTCWLVGHIFTTFPFYPQLRVSPKEFGGQVALRKLTTS